VVDVTQLPLLDIPRTPRKPKVGANFYNPYGILMSAFNRLQPPPIVTIRKGFEVGNVNRAGVKVGKENFEKIVTAYCASTYTGKSVANFLYGFDQLANKVLGVQRSWDSEKAKRIEKAFKTQVEKEVV